MKKLNFILLLSIGIFSLTSCMKEDIGNESESKNKTFDLLHEKVQNFSNELAIFLNSGELHQFSKNYSELNFIERQKLLSSFPFQTFDNYIKIIYEPLAKMVTYSEIYNYVDNSSDLVLETLPDGSESVEINNESRHFVNNFLNKDRIIKVGEDFQKYVGQYMVKSKNYEELKEIITENQVINSGLSYVKVIKKLGSNTFRDELNVFYEEIVTDDNAYCKNDRRLKFEYGMEGDWFQDMNDIAVFEGSRVCMATAKRKGIPCVWYTYTTDFTWLDCEFNGDFYANGSVVYTTNYTPGDLVEYTASIIDRGSLVYGTLDFGQDFEFWWTTTTSEITHRGLDGNWLVL